MSTFIIGIPSYNEADNISRLVTQIDDAAQQLGIELIILNADNNSSDGTARIFSETLTVNKKVSLLTDGVGKGRNMLHILEYMVEHPEIAYCFFIDADITSFETEWLLKHYEQYKAGVDYVVPNYERKYIEGNGTNHFAYPLMRVFMDGPAPRQPIAGDVGLSRKLAKYVLTFQPIEPIYGYGIDIFISMVALSMEGTCVEIALRQKLHKPSFDKMIRIFDEVAMTYFWLRPQLARGKAVFQPSKIRKNLLNAEPIASAKLTERLHEAIELYKANEYGIIPEAKTYFERGRLSTDRWVYCLALHEAKIGKYTPKQLARSLTPFYLLRAVTYLRETTSPSEATTLIEQQADTIQTSIRHTHEAEQSDKFLNKFKTRTR